MKQPLPSFDDLVRIIADSSKLVVEEPLPGFFTVEQIAERSKMSPRAVSRSIARGVAAGTVERKTFRILCTSGRIYPVPHYRAKKPGH